MAAVSLGPNSLQSLREEVVCTICLDYFTDPVSIGCGHTYCRVCINLLWGGEDEEAGEVAREEDGEEEDVEAEEAGGSWDAPMRHGDYQGDEEDEEDVSTGGVGASNRENVDDMWEVQDGEEGRDHFSRGMKADWMGQEEEEDLDPAVPQAPPPSPLWRFACPQCLQNFPKRNFHPNLHLVNLVAMIRQMVAIQGSCGNKRGVCPQHRQALKLYCEVDKEAVCVVCRECSKHKPHSVVPLEEVVHYQAQVQGHVEPLRKHMETMQKRSIEDDRRVTALESWKESEQTAMASEFARLRQFVDEEQAQLEQRLQYTYEDVLARARSRARHAHRRLAQLSRLLAEAQERSQPGALPLLQDLKDTLQRCEEVEAQLQVPEVRFSGPCQARIYDFLTDAMGKKISRMFCQPSRVDVMLDPGMAHPALMLSPDHREVHLPEWLGPPPGREAAGHPERQSTDCYVLGTLGFCSGRHYWEVEVTGWWGWAVGVARKPPGSKEVCSRGSSVGVGDASSSSGHHHCRPQQSQEELEIWSLGTRVRLYHPPTLQSPTENTWRLGMFLDYEAGRLEVYDVETLVPMHTFLVAFLGKPIFPFFRVLSKGTRIKLCP